jgi:hypothetical protein
VDQISDKILEQINAIIPPEEDPKPEDELIP